MQQTRPTPLRSTRAQETRSPTPTRQDATPSRSATRPTSTRTLPRGELGQRTARSAPSRRRSRSPRRAAADTRRRRYVRLHARRALSDRAARGQLHPRRGGSKDADSRPWLVRLLQRARAAHGHRSGDHRRGRPYGNQHGQRRHHPEARPAERDQQVGAGRRRRVLRQRDFWSARRSSGTAKQTPAESGDWPNYTVDVWGMSTRAPLSSGCNLSVTGSQLGAAYAGILMMGQGAPNHTSHSTSVTARWREPTRSARSLAAPTGPA